MKKNRAVRRLIYMAITVLIGILLVCFGFNIPFTTQKFTGFYNGLLKTNELTSGIVAVYNIERVGLDSDYRLDVETTKSHIENFFGIRNQSVKVTRLGDDKLKVEAGALSSVETLLNNIGSYMQLNFRGSADGEKALTGEDIKSISVRRNTTEGGYGAYFEFTESGAEKLKTLSSSIVSDGESLYIYGGEDGETQLQTISLSQEITDGALFLSGSMNTYLETQTYISQFLNGIFPVKLTLESSSYIYLTEPSLNYGALVGTILTALFIVGSIVFICLKYKHLGLVTAMSLLANFVLTIGICSSISILQTNLYGMFAFALSYLIAYICNLVILEKIKREYANGKKLPGSFKAGLNKSIFPILDLNILPVIFGLLLLWLGNLQVKSFGFIMFIGFAVNMFTSLLLTRGLLNTYLTYNSTKPNKIGFKREENIDEIA